MNRRRFVNVLTRVAAQSAFGASASPIRLQHGPHLFLDDYLIESQANLRRTISPPARLPDPVLTAKDDCTWQPWLSVLRDSSRGRFRIWYTGWDGSKSRLTYLESSDGIRWQRPHRFLDVPAPVTDAANVFDEGLDYSNPSQRYKAAGCTSKPNKLWVAASPDGLNWKSVTQGVAIPGQVDISHVLKDRARGRYLAIVGTPGTKADGYKGKTPNMPEDGYRRLVGASTSPDLLHWSPLRRIVMADATDKGITEFYGIGGVVARSNLLVGMLKVLRDDLPAESGGDVAGIGYTVLAWSRDGETWQRDRQPFLDRNPQPRSWDRAMTWVDSQVAVDDEIYLYYGGYARGHKIERHSERQIGLARMPRDRWLSREAGPDGGTLRTPAVMLDAGRMTINAQTEAAGELKVRALDPAGKPWAGFDWSQPIRGDAVAHPVRWKKSIAALAGKPARLEFTMKSARLYGFELDSLVR